MSESNNINFLTRLERKDWFDLIDFVFQNFSLPDPFVFNKDYPTEILVNLNNYILANSNNELLKIYHTILIDYYLALQNNQYNYDKIYSFHRVFSRIKIKENTDNLFEQLYTNFFINSYKDQILLQTSLLSMLLEIPDIKVNNLSTYLVNSIGRTENIAFYRVSFRYFIRERTTFEFIKYFIQFVLIYKINSNNIDNIANLLVESIMDFRYYRGSFEKLYDYIDRDNFWIKIFKSNPSLIKKTTFLLNKKYLKPGKEWYDNDIYAKFFKLYINSLEVPPPLELLEKSIKELREISIIDPFFKRRIRKFSDLKDSWKSFSYTVIDEDNDDPYLEAYYAVVKLVKKQPENILNSDNWFSRYLLTKKDCKLLEKHYKKVFNLEIRKAVEVSKPSLILTNMILNSKGIKQLPQSVLDKLDIPKESAYAQ